MNDNWFPVLEKPYKLSDSYWEPDDGDDTDPRKWMTDDELQEWHDEQDRRFEQSFDFDDFERQCDF